jgi:hypothetical protein
MGLQCQSFFWNGVRTGLYILVRLFICSEVFRLRFGLQVANERSYDSVLNMSVLFHYMVSGTIKSIYF